MMGVTTGELISLLIVMMPFVILVVVYQLGKGKEKSISDDDGTSKT